MFLRPRHRHQASAPSSSRSCHAALSALGLNKRRSKKRRTQRRRRKNRSRRVQARGTTSDTRWQSRSSGLRRTESSAHRYGRTRLWLFRECSLTFRQEQLATSLVLFLTFWFVGAAVFGRLEGWTYGIAFYFVFVMASSIGYGDYAPETQAGRAFFCVWAILGAGILTVLFSVIADAYTSRFSESRFATASQQERNS